MMQTKAAILSALEILQDIYLLRLEAPHIAAVARPGQFVMVRCGDDTVLPRPFSIYRTDRESIALLYADVGKGTHWLSERKRGETLNIFGPLGNGFSLHEKDMNLLLVAGGMGIAPLTFLAETAIRQKKTVTVICGARTSTCLLPFSIPQAVFAEGLDPKSVNVVNVTEDGTEGTQGRATDFIGTYADTTDRIYACGPLPMYRSMVQDYGMWKKPVQVSLECVMGCGTGVCYGCTIRTRNGLQQVCKDGPVFDFKDIDWELTVENLTPSRQ